MSLSWVTIDQEKCTACGLCAKRCARCFSNIDGVITVQADADCCVLCGHCVALCSTGAISHSRMDMSNFPELEGPVSFETDEFIRFVRQRRSHRGYRNKAVPRADLEKLVQMCRYIPTGSNLQTVEIKVMTNPQRIKKISDLTVDYFVEMIDQAEKEVSRLVSEGREIPPELAVRREFVNRYSRMKAARDLGLDPILHQAPAVMIFHSAPSPSTPKDDCVIAAQTVVLAAMTLGLGTCYIGLLVKAAADSPAVREALDLPEGNTAHSVLVMGYPRLKFHRAVDRRPIAVQWDE